MLIGPLCAPLREFNLHSRVARADWRALLVLAAVTLVACDKMPLTAPTSSTISLTSAALTLPTGGTTQVTATVLESSGSAVQNGTTVRFTSTLGTIDPAEAQTHNGVAVATFTAGTVSGTAEIRATSGSASGTSTPSTGTGGTTTPSASSSGGGAALSITIGGANVSTVVVSASPSNVPSTGGTVTLIATAIDANGNRLVGVPVTFSTTAGTLSSTVAITDANGEARVTLTTNRTATVTVTAGSKTATTTVNVSAANSIAVAVSPTSTAINTPVTLTVTPTVGTNNVAPNVVIDWGDGTTTDLGTVASARTVVHSYKTPGIYTITATARSEGGETTQSSVPVTITAQAPLGVTISASPTNPAVGDIVTFTANITGDQTAVATQYVWTVTSNTPAENGTFTTTSPQLQLTFGTAGVKTVAVTVTTTTNKTATGQTQVRVQ
jgi:adhesin/invasin